MASSVPMEKDPPAMDIQELDDSDDDSSLAEAFDEEMTEEVSGIYCPVKYIPEMADEIGVALRMDDDRNFFNQMKKDPYLKKMVKYLFDNARRHEIVEKDEADEAMMSTIMTVTEHHLTNRAQLCSNMAKALEKNNYSDKVIEEIRGEIMVVMLMLEPFVLTKEDCERNKELASSHFQTISDLYRWVEQAYKEAKKHQKFEEGKEKADNLQARAGTDMKSGAAGKREATVDHGDIGQMMDDSQMSTYLADTTVPSMTPQSPETPGGKRPRNED